MTMKEKRQAKEIRLLQESKELFFPKATFRRLVTEIAHNYVPDVRFNSDSVAALQTAAEDEITTTFTGANIVARTAGRDTVTPHDVKVFQALRTM